MPATRRAAGFTLIELAVVTAIIALLLGGLLVPLANQVELSEVREAEDDLAEIRDAIFGFAMVNDRLPCPDCAAAGGDCAAGEVNDGIGDPNPMAAGNSCDTDWGNVPWSDLGTPENDPWGERYYYKVTDSFANMEVGGAVSFNLTDNGDITVEETNGGNDIATQVPALVLSTGPNAYDATEVQSTDEVSNVNNADSTFVSKDVIKGGEATEFDDLVIWISPFVLKKRMVDVEKLP